VARDVRKHKQMKNKDCGIIDKGILRGSVYDLHPQDKALRLHYALIACVIYNTDYPYL
jgi:hypothetical protein